MVTKWSRTRIFGNSSHNLNLSKLNFKRTAIILTFHIPRGGLRKLVASSRTQSRGVFYVVAPSEISRFPFWGTIPERVAQLPELGSTPTGFGPRSNWWLKSEASVAHSCRSGRACDVNPERTTSEIVARFTLDEGYVVSSAGSTNYPTLELDLCRLNYLYRTLCEVDRFSSGMLIVWRFWRFWLVSDIFQN